jgi:hypothetical protein
VFNIYLEQYGGGGILGEIICFLIGNGFNYMVEIIKKERLKEDKITIRFYIFHCP